MMEIILNAIEMQDLHVLNEIYDSENDYYPMQYAEFEVFVVDEEMLH